MADRRAHEPKLAALAAYHAGALSPTGRARVRRHLASCAVCNQALAGLARYATLLDAAHGAEPPAVDWSRLELPLQREALRLRRRHGLRRFAAPTALVAAACLALVLASERQPSGPVAHAPRQPPPAPIERVEYLDVRIAAIVGSVHARDPAGVEVALDLATGLREGYRLRTQAGAELHLVLDRTAAVLLPADSELVLARVRPGEVELALERGQVVSAVQPLGERRRYQIASLGHQVAVRGTLFSVEQVASSLAVQVDEGTVVVLREGTLVVELRAPERWMQEPSHPQPKRAARLHRPYEPASGFAAWPELQVPSWPHVIEWSIDDHRLGAGAELRMRVPIGDVDIRALLDDGRRMRGRVHVDALGARFDPRSLVLVGPAPSEPAASAPDPAQAAAVIRAAQPDLQRCYERSLRQRPSGALRARLRLRIDAGGKVREIELQADEPVPELLSQCIEALALRWKFPAPGSPGITFEAPLRFQPRD